MLHCQASFSDKQTNIVSCHVYVSHPVGKDLVGGVFIIMTGNGDGGFQIGVLIRVRRFSEVGCIPWAIPNEGQLCSTVVE